MSRPLTVTRTWREAQAACTASRTVGAERARSANTLIAAGTGAGVTGAGLGVATGSGGAAEQCTSWTCAGVRERGAGQDERERSQRC